MKERIQQILDYLIDPDSKELRDPSVLRSELEKMGYSNDEINRALNMLNNEDGYNNMGFKQIRRTKTRIFCEMEKTILTVSAQGYLIELYRLGWLSEAQLALILEGAIMEYSTPVSLEDIKQIALKYTPGLSESVNDRSSPSRSVVH